MFDNFDSDDTFDSDTDDDFDFDDGPDPTIEFLKKQIALVPGDVYLRLALAMLYERHGKADDAIEEYQEVLKLAPDNYDAHYHLGILYHGLGRDEDAVAELQKATALSPKRYEPWFLLGAIHFKDQRIAEAVEDYEKAVDLESDQAYAHYGLAMGYLRSGRYAEAVDGFKKALHFDSKLTDAKFRIEHVPKLSRSPDDEIRAAMEAAVKNMDDAAAHHWLGVVLMLMGVMEESVVELKNAVGLDPDNARYYYDLAFALDYEDDERAAETLMEVLRLEPKNVEALLFLGIIHSESRRLDEGMRTFKRAIKIEPDNEWAHYFLGVACGDMGVLTGDDAMLREALGAIKKALEINPDNFQAHRQLADIYAEDGLYDEAIAEYEKVLAIEPCIKTARVSIEKLREMKNT